MPASEGAARGTTRGVGSGVHARAASAPPAGAAAPQAAMETRPALAAQRRRDEVRVVVMARGHTRRRRAGHLFVGGLGTARRAGRAERRAQARLAAASMGARSYPSRPLARGHEQLRDERRAAARGRRSRPARSRRGPRRCTGRWRARGRGPPSARVIEGRRGGRGRTRAAARPAGIPLPVSRTRSTSARRLPRDLDRDAAARGA